MRLPSDKSFPASVPTALICRPYDLLKFIAHLSMMKIPIPRFDFAGLLPEHEKALNEHILVGLREAGFLSTEFMMVKSRIFQGKEGKEQKINPEYIPSIRSLFKSFSAPGLSRLIGIEEAMASLAEDQLKVYNSLEEKRKLLGRYIPLNALFLLRQTVLSIPEPYPIAAISLQREKLNETKRLLDECLHYAAVVKDKLTPIHTFDPSQHECVFKGMKTLVDRLWKNPLDFIVQVGIPIKDVKKGSEHAFYILVQFPKSAAESNFRLVIFNGGPGLSMHRKDESLAVYI